MRKLLSIVFAIAMVSCVEGQKQKETNVPSTCFTDPTDAWHFFREAANKKDTINLNKIISDQIKLQYLPFLQYKNPTLEYLTKEELGDYYIDFDYEPGIRKIFVLLKDGDKRKDVMILELKTTGNCFKVNSLYRSADSNKVIKYVTKIQTTPKKKEYARVTTIADGYDVQVVNLWSSTDGSTRKVVGNCTNNERVEVLSYSDPYVYVRKSNGVEGYFMREFLK